jgi:hypothetical protein
MNWIKTLTGTMKNSDCHYGSNAKTYALCKQKGKQGSMMMLHGNAVPNHAVGTGNMKNRGFLNSVENAFRSALASNSKPNLTTKANINLKSNNTKKNNNTKNANNTKKANTTLKANNSTKKPNISTTSNKLTHNHSNHNTKKNRF